MSEPRTQNNSPDMDPEYQRGSHFYGLRFKLVGVLGLVSMFILAVGLLGMLSIQLILNKTKIITEEELPRFEIVHEGVVQLIAANEGFTAGINVDDFSDIGIVQSNESSLRAAALKFDMLMNALAYGSESEAFAKESSGLLSTVWKQERLDSVWTIKQPSPELSQLAKQTAEDFRSFIDHAELALASHRRHLRLDYLGVHDEAERAHQEERTQSAIARSEFALATELLNQIVHNSNQVVNVAAAETEELQRQQLAIISLSTLAGFLLSILISIFFASRVIIYPLESMMEAVEQISNGDLSRRIIISSRDEIGKLSRAFNGMTNNLEDIQQHLEKKVDERTHEIENVNKNLEKNVAELERFQKLIVGRELKMIELKEEIERLKGAAK